MRKLSHILFLNIQCFSRRQMSWQLRLGITKEHTLSVPKSSMKMVVSLISNYDGWSSSSNFEFGSEPRYEQYTLKLSNICSYSNCSLNNIT